MPQHNPEDRVRVKNIVAPEQDDLQTFWLTRYDKLDYIDANGNKGTRDIPVQKEVEWNFKRGFFFIWGGEVFVLKRGEEKSYPRWLAEHCVEHMIDHVLTRKYQATKRMGTDGTPLYDLNILNNESEKKKLRNEIVLGVDEWAKAGEDDFDKMIAEQFGGDFDGMAREQTSNADKDFSLPELPQEDELVVEKKSVIPPTSDVELQKMREEADQYGIPYTDKDTTSTIKGKLLKQMA